MKQLLEAQINQALSQPERIKGWVVAVLGDRRSAFVTRNCSTTYIEANVPVLCHAEALALRNRFMNENPVLLPYLRLVPVLDGVRKWGLPTVGGVAPQIISPSQEQERLRATQFYRAIDAAIRKASLSCPDSVIYDNEAWLEWVRQRFGQMGWTVYANSVSASTLPQAAYLLASLYLKGVAGDAPHFAIPALLQGESEMHFYRAVAIWKALTCPVGGK